jgi:hypothetical protein
MAATGASPVSSLPAELLQNVLSYLSVNELLYARAVSMKWRAAIQETPELQQAMFIRAEKPRYIVRASGDEEYMNESCELVINADGYHDKMGTTSTRGYDQHEDDLIDLRYNIGRVNPSALRHYHNEDHYNACHCLLDVLRSAQMCSFHISQSTISDFHRRMHLTQPPVRHAQCGLFFEIPEGSSHLDGAVVQWRELESESGLTIGDVADCVADCIASSQEHSKLLGVSLGLGHVIELEPGVARMLLHRLRPVDSEFDSTWGGRLEACEQVPQAKAESILLLAAGTRRAANDYD